MTSKLSFPRNFNHEETNLVTLIWNIGFLPITYVKLTSSSKINFTKNLVCIVFLTKIYIVSTPVKYIAKACI
jgi:hypothetical protein